MVTTLDRMREQSHNGKPRKPPGGNSGDLPDSPDGSAWEPPIPFPEAPPVEEFPIDVLPVGLAAYIRDVAAALAGPPDFVAVPMLAIAGAAIGASRALEIKAGWRERPSLYAAVIGSPGSAKSPALRYVASPVYREQARRTEHYRRQLTAWEEMDEKGSRPVVSTLFASDITTEALASVLQDNPRGLVIIRDELVAWVSGLDQYRARGRGSDRQFYLTAWAGELVSVHRKNQEKGPLFVPHPFVAVVGGLPPDMLANLRGEKSVLDGFFDRILVSYPEPAAVKGETWACVSDEAMEAWEQTLTGLWELIPEQDEQGGPRPRVVRLTRCGRLAWERFTKTLADEMNGDSFPEFLRGPWSKHRGYCARLALIVHLLRILAGDVDTNDVDGESVDRAAVLIRYFESHSRKVYAVLNADKGIAKAGPLLEWIHREHPSEFKPWEAFKDVKNSTEFPKVDALEDALKLLVRHQMIREKKPATGPHRGRPPATVYEVNPLLF